MFIKQFRRLMRVNCIGLICAGLLVLTASSAAAATAPTTLANFNFGSTTVDGAYLTGGTCNPVATGPSTFSFFARGYVLFMPYTFTETGSFTLLTQDGPLTAFAADFKIYSAGVVVATGHKTLAVPEPSNCRPANPGMPNATPPIPPSFEQVSIKAMTNYEAAMSTTPPSTEVGTAHVTFDLFPYNPYGTFTEQFVPGTPIPVAVVPTTKQDCKHGGFAKYKFPNQGACIKYVKEHS